MSDPDDGEKTVFRPSPLQALRQGQAAPPAPNAPPAMARAPAPAPLPPIEDDVPLPAAERVVRNRLMTEAGPMLALAAGMRAGRVRTPLPQFHRRATQAIADFDRAIQPLVADGVRQRARYALCATIDDIALHLPGHGEQTAEWARRSMVAAFFKDASGERFWQLVDDALRAPAENPDLIELCHACLAAGFEGKFRALPDGKRQIGEIMARLRAAMPHVQALSTVELSPTWRGEQAPLAKVGMPSTIALAGAAALALLLAVYIVLRLLLMWGDAAPSAALAAINPDGRLRLSRVGAAMPVPPPSAQAAALRTSLAAEIAAHTLTVEEDAATVRVRTTADPLFRAKSDELAPGRAALFERIGQAMRDQPGTVTVEDHVDTDRVATLTFPDNIALSQARAGKVAGIVGKALGDPSRAVAKGMGDAVPIASNDTAEGKGRNRRVEIIVARRN